MDCISFFQPPSSPASYRYKHDASSHRKGRSVWAAISKPSTAIQCDVADREVDCVSNDVTDDDLPTLEKILHYPSRREISITELPDPRRTRHPHEATLDAKSGSMPPDQVQLRLGMAGAIVKTCPLEDDEPESTATVAEADSVGVGAGNATPNTSPSDIVPTLDQTLEPSKPIDPPGPTRWYDIEDECFIDDEPTSGPTLAEATGPPFAPTQDKLLHRSSGPSQDWDENGRITRYASEEPVAPHFLLESLGEDDEGWRDDNVAVLERELVQALEIQALELQAAAAHELPSLASVPSSPRPRRSSEPSHPRTDQQYDQGGASCGSSEEPGHGSLILDQDQEEEEQQHHERAAGEAVTEEADDNWEGGQEQRGEKRQRRDATEGLSSEIHDFESSDEDDEGPRPAKRRKLPSISADTALSPPSEPGPGRRVVRHGRLTPPSASQHGADDVQSAAERGCSPDLAENKRQCAPQTPRSPSATQESVPVAEYREWSFQGFLKRTRIGNGTTYNLEFTLPCISERLDLSISAEALGTDSSREVSVEPMISRKATLHSKIHAAVSRPLIKRAAWTPKEDAMLRRMRDDGCSWDDNHAALPHRSKGTIQVRYSTKLKN